MPPARPSLHPHSVCFNAFHLMHPTRLSGSLVGGVAKTFRKPILYAPGGELSLPRRHTTNYVRYGCCMLLNSVAVTALRTCARPSPDLSPGKETRAELKLFGVAAVRRHSASKGTDMVTRSPPPAGKNMSLRH